MAPADSSPSSSDTYSNAELELGNEDNVEDVSFEQSTLEVDKHNCHTDMHF